MSYDDLLTRMILEKVRGISSNSINILPDLKKPLDDVKKGCEVIESSDCLIIVDKNSYILGCMTKNHTNFFHRYNKISQNDFLYLIMNHCGCLSANA